ncbi:hypothetical protein F5Y11DRAFT_320163 [Daldinia sp. FL1419]|nr:hypothetical protein F5Y11DRAFT_320163 [Daldinia sp. FL1419]
MSILFYSKNLFVLYTYLRNCKNMSEKKDVPGAESVASDTEHGTGVVLPKNGVLGGLVHRRNDLNQLGKDMLQQSLRYDRAQLQAHAIKVRWKLDLLVLPMV